MSRVRRSTRNKKKKKEIKEGTCNPKKAKRGKENPVIDPLSALSLDNGPRAGACPSTSANAALKKYPEQMLRNDKINFSPFRNAMLMVLQNTRVEDEELGVNTNLLKLCFIEDPQAAVKLKALTGRESDKYRFANDSTIIMIAKCLEYRLQPKHDDMGEAYLLWESLRPVRSVIIAAAAVAEIEDLACSEFDNNSAYFDEMVSLQQSKN
jgi:hypothetical protein